MDIENCITCNEEGPKCGGFVDSIYSVGASSWWCYPRGWRVDGEAILGWGCGEASRGPPGTKLREVFIVKVMQRPPSVVCPRHLSCLTLDLAPRQEQ